MISNLLIAAVFFLAFISAAIDTHAATLTVTKTADTADGVCDSDCSLREAVTSVGRDNTIVFSPLFNTPQTITLTNGQLAIIQNMMIDGPGAGLLTINGNNASRIFRISGGVNVTLEGMKLTNGRAFEGNDPFGGALYVVQSSLSLTNMIVSNNAAPSDGFGFGGGIGLEEGTLTVQNSSIANNVGGGIYGTSSNINIAGSSISYNQNQGVSGSGPTLNVVDSNVSHNTGTAVGNSGGSTMVIRCTVRYNGGGVGSVGSPSSLIIDESVISHNEPSGGLGFTGINAMVRNTVIDNNFANGIGRRGGGIFNTGTMHILNSSVTNNRAFESGAGIFNSTGQMYITNSTVSGNRADNGSGNCNCPGGGVLNLWNKSNPGGTIVITNSTITNNRAAGRGGGIRNEPGGVLLIRNTIVGGNTSFTNEIDISGASQSEGFNLIGNTTGSTGWLVTDFLNVNPLLAPLGINGGQTKTHALMLGSPAINAGSNKLAVDPFDDSLLAFDQRGPGFPRVVGSTVDIGAYEANYSLVPVTLSGRVITTAGYGIPRTVVTLTDTTGSVRYAQSNPFGYYRFYNIPSSVTFTINISNKSHQFDSPQFITTDRDRNDLNFFAQ